MVTPTGMGLIKTILSIYGDMPEVDLVRTGYGFANIDIRKRGALKAIIGMNYARCFSCLIISLTI